MCQALRRQRLPAADMDATSFGRSDTGSGALADERALELGQRAHHVEDQAPAGSRRVDALAQGAKVDASLAQIAHHVDQMRQRAAQTVEFPDHEHIAGLGGLQRTGQTGPFYDRARHLILEGLRTARSGEGAPLQVQVLVLGRDAGVADQHRGILGHLFGTEKALRINGCRSVP